MVMNAGEDVVFPGRSGRETIVRRGWIPLLAVTAALGCFACAGAPSQPRQVTDDGAWCWFGDPRVVFHDGRTYAGWISSQGDVWISSFDHTSGEMQRAKIREALDRDDHANPALLVHPDGRLSIFYTQHAGKAMYVRTMTEPGDITSWSDERALVLNRGNTRRNNYCYPNPVRLPGEGNRIYLFWRGDNWKPTVSVSDDDGKTWSEGRIAISRPGAGPGNRPYLKVVGDHDRIHLAFTDGHPRNEPQNSIYYACLRRGVFYRADDTPIGQLENGPLDPARADLVHDGPRSGVRAWIWDVASDARQRPVLVYALLPDAGEHEYAYASWTGERWQAHEICRAGKWFPQTPEGVTEREPHYSAGVVLDHRNPSIVYLSRPRSGVREIERWVTHDRGESWTHDPVTSGSRFDNVRPVVARDAAGVYWMRIHGHYIHYTDFLTGIWTNAGRR